MLGPAPGQLFAEADPPPGGHDSFPDGATVLVAGPADGVLAQWGDLLRPPLSGALPPGTRVRLENTGASDGVTGANRFGARVSPDGRTVLLAPGEAAFAWLTGDPRAKFDVGQWVPVLAGTSSALVVGRSVPTTTGRPVRVAIRSIHSPDLAAVLALDLLRTRPVPIAGIGDGGLAEAFRRGRVDVALLHGERVTDRLAVLRAAGVRPLFSTGVSDNAGTPARDPSFPQIPHLEEVYTTLYGHQPGGPLYQGWRATAAAARLSFALVLAEPTPAAMVALWRQAGMEATHALDVQAAAHAAEVNPRPAPQANASMAPIAADVPALLALRQWLGSQHPG